MFVMTTTDKPKKELTELQKQIIATKKTLRDLEKKEFQQKITPIAEKILKDLKAKKLSDTQIKNILAVIKNKLSADTSA